MEPPEAAIALVLSLPEPLDTTLKKLIEEAVITRCRQFFSNLASEVFRYIELLFVATTIAAKISLLKSTFTME